MKPLTKVLGMSPAMLKMTRDGKLEARMKDLAVEAMVNLLDGGNIVLVDDEGIEREYTLRELDRSVLQKRQERACDHEYGLVDVPRGFTGRVNQTCLRCGADSPAVTVSIPEDAPIGLEMMGRFIVTEPFGPIDEEQS